MNLSTVKRVCCIIFVLSMFIAANAESQAGAEKKLEDRIADRTFPSVFQAWGPADNLKEDTMVTAARHDLIFHGADFFGLQWNNDYLGLATGFTPESIAKGLKKRQDFLKLNPNLVLLMEIRYRDAYKSFLPEGHKWWRRDDKGNIVPGWVEGGYFQLDFSNPEYQEQVALQAKAAIETGVVDGIMIDWWKDDEGRLALIRAIRKSIGEKALILANANDLTTPMTAPYINGYFMECYRSETVEDWKRIADTLAWAEKNLRAPHINCLETWYHTSREDMNLLRVNAALLLVLSDGYCLFTDPGSLPTPDHLHNWYPLWDIKLGKPLAPGAARKDGSFSREFDNGTVVYNPMGNALVTIAFDESRTSIATGKRARIHTVSAYDGDFFLKEGTSSQSEKTSFGAFAMTPPMGWNSYDSFGATVTEDEVRENADVMETYLKDYGWEYIVIDFCWYNPLPAGFTNPTQSKDFKPSLAMDEYGRLMPVTNRYPSAADGKGFTVLADYIHSKGLKFGIHVMRGIPREAVAKKLPVKGTSYTADQIADTKNICPWLNAMYGVDMTKPGAQEYYDSLFELYASWGVDYVKVDDISMPYHKEEIEAVRRAIDRCGRPIVLSLSPGATPIEQAEHVKTQANLWRISADFWDQWDRLKHQFVLLHQWEAYISDGHFPDADMIPFARLSQRGPYYEPYFCRFTPDEKVTLITLWCIARSPLMYGGDLRYLHGDDYRLLSNSEVLAVNQHSRNNRQLYDRDGLIVWTADDTDSPDKYIALFNTRDPKKGKEEEHISVALSELGLSGTCRVRDLWDGKDLGQFSGTYRVSVPFHGAKIFRISAE